MSDFSVEDSTGSGILVAVSDRLVSIVYHVCPVDLTSYGVVHAKLTLASLQSLVVGEIERGG